jgi:hypothetical protein
MPATATSSPAARITHVPPSTGAKLVGILGVAVLGGALAI